MVRVVPQPVQPARLCVVVRKPRMLKPAPRKALTTFGSEIMRETKISLGFL